eukprot:IDg627t1
MDLTAPAGVRMEKLHDTNFHSWRQRMELVLGHRQDKTARMTIGLTLSDEMLKNVTNTTTALEMWSEICNVHQRHTLLNKLSARRDFYTATMQNGEKMLVYINRIRQMAATLKSMDVVIDDKEMAMAVLNGLPQRFETIITALDAIGDDDISFTFDKVRGRLLQEEKRFTMRESSSQSTKSSALVHSVPSRSSSSSSKRCTHCGRTNHTEPHCWEKYGRPASNSRRRPGRPPRHKDTTTTAAVAIEKPSSLLTKTIAPTTFASWPLNLR